MFRRFRKEDVQKHSFSRFSAKGCRKPKPAKKSAGGIDPGTPVLRHPKTTFSGTSSNCRRGKGGGYPLSSSKYPTRRTTSADIYIYIEIFMCMQPRIGAYETCQSLLMGIYLLSSLSGGNWCVPFCLQFVCFLRLVERKTKGNTTNCVGLVEKSTPKETRCAKLFFFFRGGGVQLLSPPSFFPFRRQLGAFVGPAARYFVAGRDLQQLSLRKVRGELEASGAIAGVSWLWVKTNGIPFWARCTTHFRTYFSGWIG